MTTSRAPEAAVQPRWWHLRTWPLAVRVVVVTVVLSVAAVTVVGSYISSMIADGLFEQRQARIVEETSDLRAEFLDVSRGLRTATTTQRQDASTAFIQSAVRSDESTRREVALLPVEPGTGVLPVASDRRLLELPTPEFTEALATEPDTVAWMSIPFTDATGREQPAILVGTRVATIGGGSFDLIAVYPLTNEQRTLELVQQVMLGGGVVLTALLVAIAFVVARIVTNPLTRAALAAERLADGDLSDRMEIVGSDEIARVGTSFNRMAESLEQKIDDLTELSRVQQRFVSDVSHELRTPLTTIHMASSVLDSHRENFTPDVARTVELLSTQVQRFEALLADLLEISRFDAGAAVLEVLPESIDALTQTAVDDVQHAAAEHGCELIVHLDGSEPTVEVDRRRISRILRNLLTNAIEHGKGHPVVIHTGHSPSAVAVTVQDFGTGISPEDAAHVFDRFWRADPARTRTLGGTGLGLAISLEDAQLHGGWLQAWGQEGEGAVFRLTVPRHPGGSIGQSPLELQCSFTNPGAGEDVKTAPEHASRPEDLPRFGTGAIPIIESDEL